MKILLETVSEVCHDFWGGKGSVTVELFGIDLGNRTTDVKGKCYSFKNITLALGCQRCYRCWVTKHL